SALFFRRHVFPRLAQRFFHESFLRFRQRHDRRSAKSPRARRGPKRFWIFFDILSLSLRRELHHAPIFLEAQRCKYFSALPRAKIRMPHMFFFNSAGKTQRKLAEFSARH